MGLTYISFILGGILLVINMIILNVFWYNIAGPGQLMSAYFIFLMQNKVGPHLYAVGA